MHWIALQWRPDPDAAVDHPTPEALGWWALQFTPRVAWVDEALLLEVSASLRLWRGGRALLRRIIESNPAAAPLDHAHDAIGLIALALLRQRVRGRLPPSHRPAQLPLDTLTAARPHLPLLARLGCRTWGDVHALPRAPMVRRFGADLRTALDRAWGLVPENQRWLTLPEVFNQALELPAPVEDAPALIWSASRLLSSLQIWLHARQRGVLAFQLSWRLDLKRLDGRPLPPGQSLTIRTAKPTPPRRLFTGLFPPEEACAAIDAERQRWPGLPRRLHPLTERMHITLQFFNRVDAPLERDWLDALATLRFDPFEISLTLVELWQAPSGTIAVLLPERTPELDALHHATALLARHVGLPAATQDWQSHLTTLRRAERATIAPIRWTVRHVDLIWSDLQSKPPCYYRLGCFPA